MSTTFNDEIESAKQAIIAYETISKDMLNFINDLNKYDKNVIDIKFYKATNRIIKLQYREYIKNEIELETGWDGAKFYSINFATIGLSETIKIKSRDKEDVKIEIQKAVDLIKGWIVSYNESIKEFEELNKNEENIMKELKAVFEKYGIKSKKFQFIEKNRYNF